MIFFNIKKAREFLLNNYKVYTLRKSLYKKKSDLAVYREKNKLKRIGKVDIRLIGVINSVHQLNWCYKLSGFNSPKEWFDLAVKLHKKLPLYLYKVEIITKEEE